MRPPPEQHIHIHLPRRDQQAVRITLRYYRVAVCEADAQAAMLHNFREGEARGFGVKVAFHDVQFGSGLPEEVVCFFVGEVA